MLITLSPSPDSDAGALVSMEPLHLHHPFRKVMGSSINRETMVKIPHPKNFLDIQIFIYQRLSYLSQVVQSVLLLKFQV